jgi:hypothetical protein
LSGITTSPEEDLRALLLEFLGIVSRTKEALSGYYVAHMNASTAMSLEFTSNADLESGEVGSLEPENSALHQLWF